MAATLSWWQKNYTFYPIGNTSATCLTRNISPDSPANIPLLPCGDPGNVLYTLFCEPSKMRRKLDFTCCDYHPGVLARNVLLLSMIMDRAFLKTMWNIFFHMYIDDKSRAILISQNRKLAKHSATLADWHSSPYGMVIKMGSEHTLAELRRHWDLYTSFYHIPSDDPRLTTLRQAMNQTRTRILKLHENGTPVKSAFAFSSAPMHVEALHLYSEQCRRFWDTGTIFTDEALIASATYLNSTFFYSRAGEGFNIHEESTNPIAPFNLAALFGNSSRDVTAQDMVDAALDQFGDWCDAFRAAIDVRGVSPVIRHLLGDAIAVAHVLNVGVVPLAFRRPYHVAQWTARVLELSREEYIVSQAPRHFDVIDTSNVSDYTGLINLFIAVSPILSSSNAVLYPQTLNGRWVDPFTAPLDINFSADLSVIAMVFDLAPVDALSGFTTQSDTHGYLEALCGQSVDEL